MAPSIKFASSLAALALVAAPASAQPTRAGGATLTATLTGAAEVPGPGDPDGTGSFRAKIVPGAKEICYDITVAGIDTPTAAHIHKGSTTEAGPVFVALTTPPLGSSSSCVAVTSQQAAAILSKPAQYYVNVHTAPPYAAGAIRGQLSRAR